MGRHRPPVLAHRTALIGVTLALALALVAGAALASGVFEVPWFSVDGGGGQSAGGGYTLAGSIGQPDAGAVSGGGYALLGGFWTGSGVDCWEYLPVIMK